jgi:hypothetical protein
VLIHTTSQQKGHPQGVAVLLVEVAGNPPALLKEVLPDGAD